MIRAEMISNLDRLLRAVKVLTKRESIIASYPSGRRGCLYCQMPNNGHTKGCPYLCARELARFVTKRFEREKKIRRYRAVGPRQYAETPVGSKNSGMNIGQS
jgi:hypothetical protein